MPTLQEWENALARPRVITVDSTDALADEVNARPKSKSFDDIPKLATGLDDFSPPRQIQIAPIQLLHALGRITTPRIDNLVDISSTWAKLRYIWAFDIAVSDLVLSEEAQTIDFHQKGLLSDEIGVGMAAVLLEQYFEALNPVDVDVALRNNMIDGLRQGYKTSPDYIFTRRDGSYVVVECKGTQSQRSDLLGQLKRGTEQVPSLIFQDGNDPVSMVIGTWLAQRRTMVYVIDPPSGEATGKKFRKRLIDNQTSFRRNVVDAQQASLYQFIGANGLANKLAPSEKIRPEDIRNEPPQQKRIAEVEEDFVGVSQTVSLIGEASRVQVFQGMPRRLYQSLAADSWEHTRGRFDDFYGKAEAITP